MPDEYFNPRVSCADMCIHLRRDRVFKGVQLGSGSRTLFLLRRSTLRLWRFVGDLKNFRHCQIFMAVYQLDSAMIQSFPAYEAYVIHIPQTLRLESKRLANDSSVVYHPGDS